MVPRGLAANVPDLSEPLLVILAWDQTQQALLIARIPVRARLPQHEDELDVILHDTVWLVGFAEDRGTRVGLVLRICDLVPNYRREIVEPDFSAPDSNGGMQGKDHMATELTTREAYVSDDGDQP